MKQLTYRLTLTIQGPLLSKASGTLGFGLDAEQADGYTQRAHLDFDFFWKFQDGGTLTRPSPASALK